MRVWILISLIGLSTGCGVVFGEEEEDNSSQVNCPDWTLTTDSTTIYGNIGKSDQTPTGILMSFEQPPIEDDTQAGTLVSATPVSLSVGNKQGTDIVLQIIQNPFVYSSSTKEDGKPVSYAPPVLQVTSNQNGMVTGLITGQLIKTDTARNPSTPRGVETNTVNPASVTHGANEQRTTHRAVGMGCGLIHLINQRGQRLPTRRARLAWWSNGDDIPQQQRPL